MPVEDARGFVTICVDCYGSRYGQDEADVNAQRTRDEQGDERRP